MDCISISNGGINYFDDYTGIEPMKYITALILILTMNQTQAELVTIGWTLATEREDGTPLDISEIEGTNFLFKYIGMDFGPFLLPPNVLSLPLSTDSNESCLKFWTVLLDGMESTPTEWLCLTNTPEVE